jgi:hypothetical protein
MDISRLFWKCMLAEDAAPYRARKLFCPGFYKYTAPFGTLHGTPSSQRNDTTRGRLRFCLRIEQYYRRRWIRWWMESWWWFVGNTKYIGEYYSIGEWSKYIGEWYLRR